MTPDCLVSILGKACTSHCSTLLLQTNVVLLWDTLFVKVHLVSVQGIIIPGCQCDKDSTSKFNCISSFTNFYVIHGMVD